MIKAIYRRSDTELYKIRDFKCVVVCENPSLFKGASSINIYNLDEEKLESLKKLTVTTKKEFNKVFKKLSKLAKEI